MKKLVLVLLLNLLGASFISDAQNLILLNGADSLREDLSGKLKQDQPGNRRKAGEYFPDLPLGDRKITIRQLLSLTSGLPELTQNETFMNTLDQKRSVDEIIDLMGSGMNSVNLIFPDYDLSITVIRNVSKPKVSSVEIALSAAGYLIGSADN